MTSFLAGLILGLAHFAGLRWSVRRLLFRPRAFMGGCALRLTLTVLGLSWAARLDGSPGLALPGIWLARYLAMRGGKLWS